MKHPFIKSAKRTAYLTELLEYGAYQSTAASAAPDLIKSGSIVETTTPTIKLNTIGKQDYLASVTPDESITADGPGQRHHHLTQHTNCAS